MFLFYKEENTVSVFGATRKLFLTLTYCYLYAWNKLVDLF